jgi:phosphatidylglycerol:prolipoprotein diacylglycerol transferase
VYPVLFEIGNFQLSTFGVMMALAFLVGGEMAARSFAGFGQKRDVAWQLVTWCAIGGLLGAKLWNVAEELARHPDQSVWSLVFSRAGLTWYGGLVGGTVAGILGGLHHRVPILTLVNLTSPTLAAGQAIGRIGCLLVGDDYGRATDLPWGIAFPQGSPPIDIPVHPTMIYEALWLGLAALWLWRRRGRSPFLFGEYLFLAGLGRLWIEALRINPPLLGPLSNAQVVATVCIVVGAVGWLYLVSRRTGELKRNAA